MVAQSCGTGRDLAQYDLGIMYEAGKGVRQDITRPSNGIGRLRQEGTH